MTSLRPLLAGRNVSRRPRTRRLGVESLEGRQVLSTVGGAFVGPLPMYQSAAVSKAAASSAPPSPTPDSPQSGKAFSFDLEWTYFKDAQTGTYYLDIQDQAHSDATTSVIYIERNGGQISFALTPTGGSNSTYVNGPVVGTNTHFTERVFATNWEASPRARTGRSPTTSALRSPRSSRSRGSRPATSRCPAPATRRTRPPRSR